MSSPSYTEEDLNRAYNKAKIGLIRQPNSTFITTVLFSLKTHFVKEADTGIPTAGVDGINLYMNQDFFMGLTHEERMGLLAHEAWHVAFQHMFRKGLRDHKIHNEACDHVINLMLEDAGIKLPAGALKDPSYKDLSSEEVYNIIFKDAKKQNPNFKPDLIIGGSGQGPKPEGSGVGDQPTPEQQAALEAAVKEILVKAAIQSKMNGDAPGTVPGEVQIHLDKLLRPKLPWQTLLYNYVSTISKDDYSFRRPNRRFAPDHYLPSAYSEKVGEIAVAVDTSGSVSDKEFKSFISEIHKIQSVFNPELLTVIDFDTDIKKVHKLKDGDDVRKVNFVGRGGTNLHPVFDYCNKTKPKVLIVFSDLECSPVKKNPGYPVIWVCVNNKRAKVDFGKLIHIEI